jgi:hypothetical protein
MIESRVHIGGEVPFPAYTGERVYMEEFYPSKGLPDHLKRWQPTVDAMLTGVKTDGPAYLMIDQSPVTAGSPQRRPGVHVDGNWDQSIRAHRAHVHHSHHAHGGYKPEIIALASDVRGCRAFIGAADGAPKDDGDCSHVDITSCQPLSMEPCITYLGNVTMLHESMPVERDCVRTLVRINVPGVEPG